MGRRKKDFTWVSLRVGRRGDTAVVTIDVARGDAAIVIIALNSLFEKTRGSAASCSRLSRFPLYRHSLPPRFLYATLLFLLSRISSYGLRGRGRGVEDGEG